MAGLQRTYERLRQRDRESPLAPPALVELAGAAYLVGHDDESLTTLIRAHQGFVQQRDLRRAGGIAARISSILMNGGNAAQAAGWLARAARLLDESGDPGVERGYLLVADARHSIMSGQLERAADKFAEAAAIGERFGDADLTSLARQGHGRVLIERGEIERGIALLDEAMVAATAGELSTIIAGIVYCSVLSACADLFDVARAREWTEALTRWCDAQPDVVPYRGECLVHRAEVISLRGVWPDALHEALLACERLGAPPGQPAFGAALYQVAALEDGRRLDIANVIWCTGFGNGLSWIDLPIFEPDGEPRHESGVAAGEPGLYFVGLHFLHSFSSTMIHGIARDAERIAGEIERRTKTVVPSTALVTPESTRAQRNCA